jgi:tetratricopeptide (TPR) repeat protein
MDMKKLFYTITVVFSLFISSVYGYENQIDKVHIIQLLKQENFSSLEKMLSEYQKEFEENVNKELKVLNAFNAFENSDPDLEKYLEKWVLKTPNSYSVHMALGIYHFHLGWLSRGNKWAKDTSSKQFAKMKAHFRKAQDEFKKTIKINPKMTIAYGHLIAIVGGDKIKSKQILDEALKNNPLSKIVRLYYVRFLEPKWGGSIAEIKKFITEAKPFYVQNKQLKEIEGSLPYAQADMLYTTYTSENVKLSLPYFDEAVQKSGRNRAVILRRAEAYDFLGKYQNALRDCNEVLNQDSQNIDALILRAKIFMILQNFEQAINDLNLAVELDKLNPEALKNKGIMFYKLDRFSESFQQFIDSLTYGYKDSVTHTYLGYIYYYTKKNYTLAAQELKTAMKFGKDNSSSWYLITASQWHDRDCDFVKSAYKYKEVCTINNNCENKKLNWALKSADYALQRGICKN